MTPQTSSEVGCSPPTTRWNKIVPRTAAGRALTESAAVYRARDSSRCLDLPRTTSWAQRFSNACSADVGESYSSATQTQGSRYSRQDPHEAELEYRNLRSRGHESESEWERAKKATCRVRTVSDWARLPHASTCSFARRAFNRKDGQSTSGGQTATSFPIPPLFFDRLLLDTAHFRTDHTSVPFALLLLRESRDTREVLQGACA